MTIGGDNCAIGSFVWSCRGRHGFVGACNFTERQEVQVISLYTKGDLFINKWNAGPRNFCCGGRSANDGSIYCMAYGGRAFSTVLSRRRLAIIGATFASAYGLVRLRNCTRFAFFYLMHRVESVDGAGWGLHVLGSGVVAAKAERRHFTHGRINETQTLVSFKHFS